MIETDRNTAYLINQLAKPIMLWRWNRALGEAAHRTDRQHKASQKIVADAETAIHDLVLDYISEVYPDVQLDG